MMSMFLEKKKIKKMWDLSRAYFQDRTKMSNKLDKSKYKIFENPDEKMFQLSEQKIDFNNDFYYTYHSPVFLLGTITRYVLPFQDRFEKRFEKRLEESLQQGLHLEISLENSKRNKKV